MISEYRRAVIMRNFFAETLNLVSHIENIVTQNQTNVVIADKIRADCKCLCYALGLVLDGITDVQPHFVAFAKQLFNVRRILRR